MKKIKILYIITKSDVGGAQKYVNDLAANLNKSDFESKILYGGKDLRWLSNKVWPWALFLNDWLAIFELVKTFRKEQPDIIHLNSSKAGVLGSLAAFLYNLTAKSYKLKAKIVFTAHGWIFNPTNHLSPALKWAYIILHKFAAYFQDTIICVSEYDYKLALHYYIAPIEKLHTVHNGIDPNMKFLDKETAKKELIKKITNNRSPITNNYFWIGSIGRLVKEKNYETLIRAATLVPNAYFFVIGDGYEKNNLQLLITNYQLQNRFFIVDPTGNDAKYLKAFDIFVMSSIKEGLPYILLEAMAAGLPIVVTEAGGIPEIITSHQNGMMVAQKNPKQLAQAISGLLANPPIAEELGKSAKSAVAKHFNAKKMIEKTENIYTSIIETNPIL